MAWQALPCVSIEADILPVCVDNTSELMAQPIPLPIQLLIAAQSTLMDTHNL